MKIKYILLLIVTISITSISAQEVETRTLREFNKISTYDGVSVQIVPSDKNEVVVSGPEIEKVVTQVSGDKLKIKMKFGSNFKGEDNHIVVYFSGDIKELKATEGSSITSNHTIKVETIELKSYEGADLYLAINAQNIIARVATGSDLSVTGSTKDLKVNINTGGSFDGSKLNAKFAEVKIATGGNATVKVSDVLDASVTMGGSIFYNEDIKTVNKSISLGGSIDVKKDNI